jgi:MFS transporter, FHS family, L-fucose permease
MTTVKKPLLPPLAIIGILFFIFGFITWLNGILIPFLKIACELTYSQALLVTFAFYIAYVCLAIPSSFILKKTGFRNGMALGLLVMAVGALLFIPAAQVRSFGLFLTGLFIQGAGLALLQTASNPYVSILGPSESAAQRISVMGICNKVAGAISPLVLGAVVLKGVSELETQLANLSEVQARADILDALAARVITPYVLMAVTLVGMAVWIFRSGLPEIQAQTNAPKVSATAAPQTLWQFPHLVLGVVALFLYVGAEVIAGDTIIQYGIAQGIPIEQAKNFTSFTLVAMLVGYLVGVLAIPRYLSQKMALRGCALLGIAFVLAIVLAQGGLSVWFVALLGLANSLMWPAIFPLAIQGLGNLTEKGSAWLVMGIGGGAVLPLLYGKVAEGIGMQYAYGILLPCYLFILFYAAKGHQVKGQRAGVSEREKAPANH